MSVYKSKRGESSVQFIETARQLEAHTFACCMKAPKRYERFLTGRIMELSSEVHDRVRAANNIWPTNRHEAQLRRDELMRANNALQNLSPKLQLLYDSILQNPDGYGWIHKAMRGSEAHCGGEEERPAAVQRPSGMKNMGQALYLLHLRQREQLVGALSEWQQLHEFLQCQQQRQRQLQQREQCEWCGLRILQEMGQDSNRQRRSSTLAEGELVPGTAKTIL